MHLYQTIDLIAREPRSTDAFVSLPGFTWEYPGAALSCAMAVFPFNFPAAAFARVTFRLVWQPRGDPICGARLVVADSGPANVLPLVEISDSTIPLGQSANSAVLLTAAFNELRLAGAWKQVILQVRGGVAGVLLHSARLELVSDLSLP